MRAALIEAEHGVMQDDEIDEQFSINVWCKFYWILKHSNMHLNLEQITAAVDSAVLNLESIRRDPQSLAGHSHRFSVT